MNLLLGQILNGIATGMLYALMGLGLSLTYGIVKKHGGEIGYNRAPDGGAVFTVRLPIAEGSSV